MFYPYANNYNFPYPQNSPSRIEIPTVNGQSGAQAFQLNSPNSSILLLDNNAPIVYLIKTDSACYKTITPYKITELQKAQSVDVQSLSDRIEAIERRLDEQSNSSAVGSTEHQSEQPRTNQSIDGSAPTERKPYTSNARLFGDKPNT